MASARSRFGVTPESVCLGAGIFGAGAPPLIRNEIHRSFMEKLSVHLTVGGTVQRPLFHALRIRQGAESAQLALAMDFPSRLASKLSIFCLDVLMSVWCTMHMGQLWRDNAADGQG